MIETPVIAALIAGAASLGVGFFNFWASFKNQNALAILNSKLSEQQAEQDANRDYEYEAKKRLYRECEPLIFQLIEASETALSHIKGMAARGKGSDGSTFREEYYLKTTMYIYSCLVQYLNLL